MYIPPKKKAFLSGLIFVYALVGIVLAALVWQGILERAPPTPIGPAGDDSSEDALFDVQPHLEAAQGFVYEKLARDNGHVDLYYLANPAGNFSGSKQTNSEAASYYLLWAAQAGDKAAFDNELAFMQRYMQHPTAGYLRWRLEENESIVGDGANDASDADLRAIKALLIAQQRWNDPAYAQMITELTNGLELVGITKDGYLAPYGGGEGKGAWRADVVWLSYSDFTVFDELSRTRGEPWISLNYKMKNATLGAQIQNGLFNTELTQARKYGTGPDGGVYSINSMWMMIRMAESHDPTLRAAANRSLQFYRMKQQVDGQLFATYGSNGDALSPEDSPWVYALVGRAAAALDDKEFAEAMIRKLVEKQVMDPASPLKGSFPEGTDQDLRGGQFTTQEAILTMQEYQRMQQRMTKK